ncbi:hypothetical protein ANN_06096 [Periplaneta americana]|uniref:Uncharacterized protein n=1 Tax=Periplaneta americana TaxID=6978 RepID=A0ABQ8TED5_PERAM|nr:hypothetical protein ANN_06096 [Periplaneta americana]
MVRRIQVLHDRLMFGGSVHDEKPLVHQNSPIAGISPAIANTAVLDSASSQSNGSPQPIKDYKNMTASQIAKDYITACLMECSIHGLNHVAAPDRTKAERSMWLVFVILALCGAVWLSLSIKQHYDESPTAISVEVNSMDWYTLYPAGTMCPHERVDDTELEKYITEK